jgi:hypothetical protein
MKYEGVWGGGVPNQNYEHGYEKGKFCIIFSPIDETGGTSWEYHFLDGKEAEALQRMENDLAWLDKMHNVNFIDNE